MSNFTEFYPTPKALLDVALDGIDWKHVETVLEPSAGKGDIVSYIREKAGDYPHYNDRIQIDCIEIDETLRNTLKGAEERVVHDDFLTFRTSKKYDLIVMNPPFSNGDEHLLKALRLQELTGGDVICILNAETIRNPYNIRRKLLKKTLEKIGAVIEYRTDEFVSAERSTKVEIAVVKAHYEEPEAESIILDGLKKKYYAEAEPVMEDTELAENDFVKAIVKAYELDLEAGIKLIKEYKALVPRLMPNVKEEDNKYATPILEMKSGYGLSVNSFVEQMRMKYWRLLFSDRRITGKMTSEQQNAFMKKVNELKDYEFSVFNIKEMQKQMSENLVSGIEECILKLFDDLTYKYSWKENADNVHYYNGWASNSAFKINKKVVIPFYGVWGSWDKRYRPTNYDVINKITDMDKALRYLSRNGSYHYSVGNVLQAAENTGQTKNIHLTYFDLTFYKKGTCHITFTDEELLKKFNIFGSQKKGWLPPSYGKKKYGEMTQEEKSVIDSFEGEESYNETISDSDYYLFDAGNVAGIEDKSIA